MTGIKWEEPELGGRSGVQSYDWASIFAELRANPGKWALVSEDGPTSMSTNIKKGTYADSYKGEFEAVSRDATLESNRNRGKIYARYVGAPDER